MDCPSEENLIRMKLDGISSIANLDFDIPNRKLTVFHSGEIDQIEKSILELNLGGKRISTEQTDQKEFIENANQKKLLWTVLGINFAFFLIEMTTGIISKSMGLVSASPFQDHLKIDFFHVYHQILKRFQCDDMVLSRATERAKSFIYP